MKNIMFLMMLSAFTLAACDEGPAEEFGRDIDNAVENTGDAIDEAATDAGNAIEDACEDVRDAAGAADPDC